MGLSKYEREDEMGVENNSQCGGFFSRSSRDDMFMLSMVGIDIFYTMLT